ncbi:MAG: YlxR family protein [Clostridia bacterium]|nr:YlxR family protein [Clostridia bacterium]MDD4685727.1 YlxR family protein [Clostridia bacterium]
METKKIPVRMCLVCRKRMPKENLIRIVKNKDDKIFIDKSFKAEGRGAYVCKDKECLLKLEKKHILNKNFKCEISNEIYQKLKGEYDTLD